MKLTSTAFADGKPIPGALAFCVIDPASHVKLSENLNPDLRWSDLPPGTKSLALICHDPDVPSRGDDVNKEGRTVPSSLARVEFFHWTLIDLPADTQPIARGEFSRGVTPRGKSGPGAPRGAHQGINDYTGWFAGDKDMAGDYHGYDGPCPPWNDERLHHYVFTLYALHRRTDYLGEQRFCQQTCFGMIRCGRCNWTTVAVNEVLSIFFLKTGRAAQLLENFECSINPLPTRFAVQIAQVLTGHGAACGSHSGA